MQHKNFERLKELAFQLSILSAEMAGISQNAISGYETGARFPSRNILEKLAKALACEARDLL